MSEKLLLVPRSDIVSIADAIRTANDIENQLIFPDDFISQISSNQSLNFNIVGGIDTPNNPKENTIWVNTSIVFNNWCVSLDEPSNLNNGDIWIHTSSKQGVSINMLSKNAIMCNIVKASQYIDGQWINVPIWVYHNGSWDTLQTFLILEGDTCNEVTGGWEAVGQQKNSSQYNTGIPTVTITNDGISISQNNTTGGVYRTKQQIDISKFSHIVFEGEVGGASTNTRLYLWPYIGSYQETTTAKYYTLTNGENIIPLEISEPCFIGFGFYGQDTITCTSLYLK